MSSSLADCLFAFYLPPNLLLQVLGLPKLSICVVVLGRLPICVFSAPQIVFRGAGLAEAEYVCPRPWQTAYLRCLCPRNCFKRVWDCLSCFSVSSCLADCLFAFSLPPKLFLDVLGLPKLILCVLVLGRLPICVVSAPETCFYKCWVCRS